MFEQESIFYHIYPLGACACAPCNSFDEEPVCNLFKIEEQIEHIKNMGFNAIYFSPIFNSSSHGYDTADYFKVDRRLGTNEDFKNLSEKLHKNGIKFVLDAVFNHVGRDFWAFKDVKEKRGYSLYADWFFINWDRNNSYNDGFSYSSWEGCDELVKLNLKNPYVREHLFAAVRFWVENFDIDGLRLDVAYCLDKDFLTEFHNFAKSLKPDFWLLGEAIHGDYNLIMNDKMLDSVTNYECYKGFYSSFNSKNMFEIAHSIKRQQGMYGDKNLYAFLDNHDVSRIATALNDCRDLKLAYSLMFALPYVPSVYYKSEFGVLGDKKQGDSCLRPSFEFQNYTDLTYHIKNLCEIRKKYDVLKYGKYSEIKLTNDFFAFTRENNFNYNENSSRKAVCAINISENNYIFNYDDINIDMPPKSAIIWVDGVCVSFETANVLCAL